MNDVLKQRLVGALILVALGIVFWPIIFVDSGQGERRDEVRIPPQPQVDTTPVEPPDMAGLRPSAETERDLEPEPVSETEFLTLAPEAPLPTTVALPAPEAKPDPKPEPKPAPKPEPKSEETKKTRSEPPVKPGLDADGLPISWILRVASLSNATRAEELRAELVGMGHKAYVKKVPSGGKTFYRIYIGPKVEKAGLERIQSQIDTKFGVTTMITRYYP
ncbi:hypothetical protein EY643_11250 [Halioglobus maricola]|uniref:SPOR domain-containing protein n=1 Tax=Halioglobus maricola TaxID=2601894 RepID=A0A5P9NKQ9_9GAMM|nr:SPOR domain-containing protein [Halioglobus maricola]QFU76189.1 hypothetical protein EY643_11250 [Halioglobus maricola]